MQTEANRLRLICALLIIITVMVYQQVPNYEFIHFDDDIYIWNNHHIKDGLSVSGLKWALTADLITETDNADYWQPVTFLTRMVDIELYGLDAAGHHMTNILLHVVNVVLLFLVLYQLTKNLGPSVFVAAVFAVHPLCVESVAWITERKDVLFAFFWLLGILIYMSYLQRPSMSRFMALFVVTLLGLMSKPMFVTFPFVLMLLDIWPLKRVRLNILNWDSYKALLAAKIPLLACSLLISMLSMSTGGVGLKGSSLGVQLLNAPVSYMWYIAKLFYPADLAIWYTHTMGQLFPLWKVALAAITMIAVFVCVLACFKKHGYLAFGWLWFTGTLVPVMIGVTHTTFADRFFYIPHIGLTIMIAWGVPELLSKWQYKRKAMLLAAAAAVMLLALCARQQTTYWSDTLTLFTRAHQVNNHNDLIYRKLGYPQELVPHYRQMQTQLVGLLFQNKQDSLAIEHLENLVQHFDHKAAAYEYLGTTCAKAKRSRLAVKYFELALTIDPKRASVHINWGIMLHINGQPDVAEQHFDEAIRIDPSLKHRQPVIQKQ